MPDYPGESISAVNSIRAHTGPLWPYLVLVAVPAVIFVLPDLISGHLLMTGDNLQQNYPLHVLVGSTYRHGQLPFWNRYIFSGTPLLAGFNAGAFYPLVGLFVVLPDRAAWIATEVVAFSVIGVGMYVFLRAMALSTVACLLGACTFAFSGTVLSQVNHVDMTEGFAAIPWMLLAVLHIVRDGRWRWSILLGVAFASVILAGAPEAMLDEALLVIAFAALSAGFDAGRWWRVLSRCGAGALLSLSLAAIQWLPGLEAISNSQRSGNGAAFAALGGFPLRSSVLSLVPYISGGYGNMGEVRYFGGYNLPELGIYLGILPLIAVLTLLHPRWPSRISGRDRLTWYLVGLIGYLLAVGPASPLEHLFNLIPLYGHQRLQSRNMITVSTAVCVLFAGWIDRTETPRQSQLGRYDRLMGAVPFVLVAVLATWAVASPASLARYFAGVAISPGVANTVREATLFALVLCAIAAAIVWLRPILRQTSWRWAAAIFVTVDLGVMVWSSQLSTVPSNALVAGTMPVQRLMAANLAPGGRITSYDPQMYNTYPQSPQGTPDLNILAGLPSVSGYASIVNGTYEATTHTHEQGDLDIAELKAGTLNRLDLQEIVTLPEYFLVPLAGLPRSLSDVRQVSERFGQDPALQRGFGADFQLTPYPFYPGPRPALQRGHSASWFFGESLEPGSAMLLFSQPAPAATEVRFGELGPGGKVRWTAPQAVPRGASTVTARLPQKSAVGLEVEALGPLPSAQGVVTAGGQPYELRGALSSAVVPDQWRQVGEAQGFTVFASRRLPEPISAVTADGRRVPVRVLSSDTKSEVVQVDAPEPVSVIRSVAWDSGWRGSVSVNGGRVRSVPVRSFQLVQEISAPAGEDEVTFRYRPPHLVLGSLLSVGSIVFLVALGIVWLVRRRSRGRTGEGPVMAAPEDERLPAEMAVLVSNGPGAAPVDGPAP
jgi:hypothetical protein